MHAPVTRGALIEPFRQEQPQRLPQRVNAVDGGRVMIGALPPPVAVQQRQIEVE